MNGLALILLTVGFIFIISGFIFKQFPPKSINYIYGYKTKSSMRNEETWKAANIYSVKLMILIGLDLVIMGALSYYFLPDLDEKSALIGIAIIVSSAIILFLLTENHLRKTFDKEGNRRKSVEN